MSKPRKRSKSRFRGYFEVAAGLVVVGLIGALTIFILDQIIMPIVVRHGVEVNAPDLRYISYRSADSICRANDLKLVRGRERVDSRIPVESILDQHPVAGVRVKKGRTIEVVVSVAENLSVCPNVIGISPREAQLLANSVGLRIDESRIQYQCSYKYPEGVVMLQHPLPITGMLPNDEIVITVSLGRLPAYVIAPHLVGRKLEEIYHILTNNQLMIGDVSNFPDNKVPPGTVLSQKPAAGSQMQPGDKIDIEIAVEPVDHSPLKTISETGVKPSEDESGSKEDNSD